MSTKRAKDRESGTGNPIKAIAPKGGSGKGNWGSDQDQINQAIDAQNQPTTGDTDATANRRRKRGKKEPDNFAALNPDESARPQQSWDDYLKSKNKKQAAVYNKSTVKSAYKKKYKANKYEQETDAMLFGGGNKNKRNKNRKKKKKKVLIQTQVFYQDREPASRGRGRGRGRGYNDNNMRGGGYQRSGGRGGGYQNRRGGGYGGDRGGGGGYNNNRRRGGGFGSRGRGSFNNDYDNNTNYQNQNEYQPNQPQQTNQQNNQNSAQQNQDNVNIPVTVQ